MFLWTDKNTILTICWSFFAKVQKTSTQRLKKLFEDNHSSKKRQFSVAKPSGGMESTFSTTLKFFCQWYILVPHSTKKSVENLKQLAKCLFFSRKIFLLEKIIWTDKNANLTMLLIFLPKSDIFPLTDRKTIVDHYFSIKNIIFLNKFIWTQWCTFHESDEFFRQNIKNFRSSCENVFANDSFPQRKIPQRVPLEAWIPAVRTVLIIFVKKSSLYNF